MSNQDILTAIILIACGVFSIWLARGYISDAPIRARHKEERESLNLERKMWSPVQKKRYSVSVAGQIFVILFQIFAVIDLVTGLSSANGAPQQMVSIGIALCLSIIPFVLFRAASAVELLRTQKEILINLDKIRIYFTGPESDD